MTTLLTQFARHIERQAAAMAAIDMTFRKVTTLEIHRTPRGRYAITALRDEKPVVTKEGFDLAAVIDQIWDAVNA